MATNIAIIAPDGNRVVAVSTAADGTETRDPNTSTAGDWPFRFDFVYVCTGARWRRYRPDDLPLKHWG